MKRNNIPRSRSLRRNQTDAEKKLWSFLRNRSLNGLKFRRQFSVGKYILDFYCPELKIGIEADGGQHYEQYGKKDDEVRAKELLKYGIENIKI
jgi:very-short-patch-repair endonuclease